MVLTYIWVSFFFIAFAVGLVQLVFFGNTQIFPDMMKAAFEMAETAVMKIGLPLTGVITLFMGLMKIGELGGMIGIMSKVIGPFFQRLFPELPKDHPVNGNIMMNFAANMLGLDSAATPMGLKAMQEMQDLNPNKDTASNAQIMFLVLNTSGLTLIPINIMAQRAIWGAKDPSDIFIPLLIATFCSTFAGLVYVGIKQKINFFDPVFMGYLLAIVGAIGGIVFYFTSLPPDRIGPISSMVSNFILLALIVSFLGLGMYRRINVFDAFIEGAKDGFQVVIKLIPYLVGLLVGIALFRTCGALDFLIRGVELSIVSIASVFGYVVNTEFVQALPTAFLKPLSGGGARAMMIETMKTHGPDSFPARLSCIFQGAADTTLFILAVYFGSVGIKKTRYSVAGGLIADFAGVLGAIFVAYLFFH
ncbi:MAG TPA: nucleoside recognition domain-containing protein [Cytophagaceae bacterium]